MDIFLPLSHITKSVLYIVGAIWWWWANLPSFDSIPPYETSSFLIPFGFYMGIVGCFEFVVGVLMVSPTKRAWWLFNISTIVSILGFSMVLSGQNPLNSVLYHISPIVIIILLPIRFVALAWIQSPFAIILFVITCLEIFVLWDERIRRRHKIIE